MRSLTRDYNPAVHSSRLRRRCLAVMLSFIATVVMTLLAPFVSPIAYEVVCSANGHRLIAVNSDRDVQDAGTPTSLADGSGHCPLCMPAAPPPPFIVLHVEPVQPLAHVLESVPAARLASLVGAPLPARGPPLLS